MFPFIILNFYKNQYTLKVHKFSEGITTKTASKKGHSLVRGSVERASKKSRKKMPQNQPKSHIKIKKKPKEKI